MHKTRLLIGGVLFIALIGGFSYAIATQRPAAQRQNQGATAPDAGLVAEPSIPPVVTPSATGTLITGTPSTTVPTKPVPTTKPTTTKPVTSSPTSSAPTPNTPAPTKPTPTPTPAPAPTSFTRTEVTQHNSASNCWTSIESNVYDLTTWVSRHPGGAQSIIRLCGTDGTAAFNGQHGSSRAPRAALVLLKIGTLQ